MAEFETIEIKKYQTDNGILIVVLLRDENKEITSKNECWTMDDVNECLNQHLGDFQQSPYLGSHKLIEKIQSE